LRTYVITADDYYDAVKKLKYFKRKGAVVHKVLIIVSVDDHRKIKDAIIRGQQALIVLVR